MTSQTTALSIGSISANDYPRPEPAPSLRNFRAWLKFRWVPVILTIIALLSMGATVAGHSRAMSPIDEWVYLDYLQKVPTQGMVFKGEEMTQEALSYMACHGQALQGRIWDLECDSSHDRMDFPYTGITSADAYTPLFFIPTSLIGYAAHFVTGIDIVAAWRWATSLWLVAGLLMFVALLRLFRVPNLVQFALGLLLIGSPFSYWTFSYVSTDAPALLMGGMLLYFAIMHLRGQMPAWPILLASVAAVALKFPFILGVMLVSLLFVIEWIIRARDSAGPQKRVWRTMFQRKNLVLPMWGVVFVGAGALFAFLWLRLVSLLAVSAERAAQGVDVDVTIYEVMRLMTSFAPLSLLHRLGTPEVGGFDAIPVPSFALVPLGWILIAGILTAFWGLTRTSKNRALVLAIAISVVSFGIILAVAVRFTQGLYFTLGARYAAILSIGLLLMVALQIRNKWATWIIIGYGSCLVLAMPVASFIVTSMEWAHG
jgi:hypothetical protein